MSLTPTQTTALVAAIAAETDAAFIEARTNGQTSLMRDFFNAPHPTVKAWNKNGSWEAVQNAIDYAKYTPSAANMPTDTAGLCRLIGILIKLNVQQNMLIGMQQRIDATDTGTLAALLDTVTGIQSGAGGNGVNPGGTAGVTVATALARPATRAEVIFGGTDHTDGSVTAKILTREGSITDDDISLALQG